MFPQDATILIPQQQPFVMIGELTYADQHIAETSFTVTAGNPLCIDGVFQESGLLENMAQTAAAHAGFMARQHNGNIKNGFIGSVTDLEVWQLPKENDTIFTSVKINDHIFDVTVITAEVFCMGVKIAAAGMKIFIQD